MKTYFLQKTAVGDGTAAGVIPVGDSRSFITGAFITISTNDQANAPNCEAVIVGIPNTSNIVVRRLSASGKAIPLSYTGSDMSAYTVARATTVTMLPDQAVATEKAGPLQAVLGAVDGSYMARIDVNPATTLAAGTAYWSMRNTGTKTVLVRIVKLKTGFAGTAAASRSVFEFIRFSAATPTGGTQIQPVKADSADAASSVGDIRLLATGLTVTGVTFATDAFHLFGTTNQLTLDHESELVFGTPGDPTEEGRLILAPGEGIAIRANSAIVAGAYAIGSIMWDERS